MKPLKLIVFPICLFIFFTLEINITAAQEANTLEYKTTKGYANPESYGGRQEILPLHQTPEGISIPSFNGRSVVSGQWRTPRVSKGFLQFAYALPTKKDKKGLLFFDLNCNNDLSDDKGIPGDVGDYHWTNFKILKITFPDKNIYHLQIQYYNSPSLERFYCTSCGYYEGKVYVGGHKRQCYLVDNNSNGVFNDTALDYNQKDILRIKIGNDLFPVYLGKYFQLDGSFYSPEPAAFGEKIKITKIQDIPLGTVTPPKDSKLIILGGDGGSIYRKDDSSPFQVPEGRWLFNKWETKRKSDLGETWTLRCEKFPDKNSFQVKKGENFQLDAGEPIAASFKILPHSKGHEIRMRLTGKLGEAINIFCMEDLSKQPVLHIRNADKSYDQSFKMSLC